MIPLEVVFLIVYAITIALFLLMHKKPFDNLIKRDIDKDFDPNKRKDAGYYRVVILGGAIVAVVITLIIKIIFY